MDGHPTRFLIVMLVDLLASEFHPGYCYICQLQLANSHHKMATLLIPRSYPSTIPESIRAWGFTAPSSGDGPISPAFCAHLMRGMWDSMYRLSLRKKWRLLLTLDVARIGEWVLVLVGLTR